MYGKPKFLFKIPPSAFKPRPDVMVGLVRIDFPEKRPSFPVNECHLRLVIRAAFHKRRKMLRQVFAAPPPRRAVVVAKLTLPSGWRLRGCSR